jgi:hypothetical protein
MPDVNTQTPTRFQTTGALVVEVSSTEHTIKRIADGEPRVTPGGTVKVALMDNDDYTGEVVRGKQRLTRVAFSVQASVEGKAALDALLDQADAGGQATTFTLHIDRYDDEDAATGGRETYTNCYLEAPGEITPAQGEGVDTVSYVVLSPDAQPAVTALGA